MAGDWIKLRSDLITSPKVVRISSALRAHKLTVIGALHATWVLFDAHSEDGVLTGYTPEALDEYLNLPGFAEAMIGVEWLTDTGESLAMPRFDNHNGQSAKRRAMESERKRAVRKLSASNADVLPPREEKRREDISIEREAASPTGDDSPTQQVVREKAPRFCIDYEAICEAFNNAFPDARPETPDGLATQTRERLLDTSKALIRELLSGDELKSARQEAITDAWTAFFLRCSTSDFLRGKRSFGDKKPFQIGLVNIINRTMFPKVLSGEAYFDEDTRSLKRWVQEQTAHA